MEKAYFNWSSGKDSALALCRALASKEYDIQTLFTVARPDGVSMHETGLPLLRRQAEATDIPLTVLLFDPDQSEAYSQTMAAQMEQFRAQGITTALFGDIYLEELRQKREENCRQAGMQAAFPLWQVPQQELLAEFLRLGFRAVTTCVDGAVLGEDFVGRELDAAFFAALPEDVDPCGERGEYHSFVYDGPIFAHPVPFTRKGTYSRDFSGVRYWYAALE